MTVSEVRLRDIAITFLSDDGSPTQDVARGLPCIKIGYTPQIERINGQFDANQIKEFWAMIDTGATFNVVDETICASASIIRYVSADGFLGSGVASVRRGTLIFVDNEGVGIPCGDEFCGAPITGHPYKAVIGRGFLKIGRLVFDGINKDYRLQLKF